MSDDLYRTGDAGSYRAADTGYTGSADTGYTSSDDPDVIRANIESTRQSLSSDVDALADKVTPSKIVERQTDKVKTKFGNLKDRVMGSASSAKDRVMGSASDAKHRVGDAGSSVGDKLGSAASAVGEAPRKVAETAQGNPLAVGLIAFGVGWLAASLIP